MGTIITISGASGSGKTTLANHFLSLGPQFRMIESVTTRLPRERDRPGEFLYIAHEEFNQMEHKDKFLWVTPPTHGTRYGTLRESVDKALESPGVSIMVITIEYLSVLRLYTGMNPQKIIGLYIMSPGRAILRSRMIARGDDPMEIEKRIEECRDWDVRANEIYEHPLVQFLQNKKTLYEFFAEAKLRCSL